MAQKTHLNPYWLRQLVQTGGTHYLSVPPKLLRAADIPPSSHLALWSPQQSLLMLELLPENAHLMSSPPAWAEYTQLLLDLRVALHTRALASFSSSTHTCTVCNSRGFVWSFDRFRLCTRCDLALVKFAAAIAQPRGP